MGYDRTWQGKYRFGPYVELSHLAEGRIWCRKCLLSTFLLRSERKVVEKEGNTMEIYSAKWGKATNGGSLPRRSQSIHLVFIWNSERFVCTHQK
jgi:hypothetical protein